MRKESTPKTKSSGRGRQPRPQRFVTKKKGYLVQRTRPIKPNNQQKPGADEHHELKSSDYVSLSSLPLDRIQDVLSGPTAGNEFVNQSFDLTRVNVCCMLSWRIKRQQGSRQRQSEGRLEAPDGMLSPPPQRGCGDATDDEKMHARNLAVSSYPRCLRLSRTPAAS